MLVIVTSNLIPEAHPPACRSNKLLKSTYHAGQFEVYEVLFKPLGERFGFS